MSVPSILRPWVKIPSRPSILYIICGVEIEPVIVVGMKKDENKSKRYPDLCMVIMRSNIDLCSFKGFLGLLLIKNPIMPKNENSFFG